MYLSSAKSYVKLTGPKREWDEFPAELQALLDNSAFDSYHGSFSFSLWFKPSVFSNLRPLIPHLNRGFFVHNRRG